MSEELDFEMPMALCSNYQASMGEIAELKEKIAELEEQNAEMKKQNAELTKIIEDLKAKLARYENPHTPSSAQRYKKKSESKKSKRRGAPNGHRGATRPTPEPDRVVEVTAVQCDRCGSTNLEDCGVEKNIIEEIPPPPKIEVIQFNRHKYKCQNCEHEFTAKNEECPQKGRFGVNMLVYLIMLKLFHKYRESPSCRVELYGRDRDSSSL